MGRDRLIDGELAHVLFEVTGHYLKRLAKLTIFRNTPSLREKAPAIIRKDIKFLSIREDSAILPAQLYFGLALLGR